jgi:membrane protease YdiL (CAAX protease family)
VALAIVRPQRRGHVQTVGDLIAGLIATLLFEALLFAIAVGLTTGRFGGGLRILGWRPRRPGAWAGWTLFAIVASYVALGVYAGVTSALGLKGLQPQGNVPNGIFDHRATVMLAIVLTVVAAPVVEETLFRGFLFNGLRRDLGFYTAATLSGCLFAIAHSSPSLIIPFTVIGMIFAFAYRRTGTLWTNVSAHVLFNLVSVLVALSK